jgi:hypothetical protein
VSSVQVHMVLHHCVTWCAEVRTQFRANLADSFITSPRWPVSTSSPSPSILLASTSSTSPPTVVQARPTATPGCPSLDHSSLLEYTAGYRQTDRHRTHITSSKYVMVGEAAADKYWVAPDFRFGISKVYFRVLQNIKPQWKTVRSTQLIYPNKSFKGLGWYNQSEGTCGCCLPEVIQWIDSVNHHFSLHILKY